jgi:hypothetical protein
MSLSNIIGAIREHEKRIFPIAGKNISDLTTKDFKTLGQKAVLGLAIPVYSFLNTGCDNPVTPPVPPVDEDIYLTVKARTIEPGDNPLITDVNPQLTLNKTDKTYSLITIDNGNGDLDSTYGIIKVKLDSDKFGNYDIIVDSTNCHSGKELSLFYDSSNNFVTQNDTRGSLKPITLNKGTSTTLEAYLMKIMKNDFDLGLFREMAQSYTGGTARFNTSTPLNIWVDYAEGTTEQDVTERAKNNLNKFYFGDATDPDASLWEATGKRLNVNKTVQWGGSQPSYPFHRVIFDKNIESGDGLNGVSLANGYIRDGAITLSADALYSDFINENGQAAGMLTDGTPGDQSAIANVRPCSDNARYTTQGKRMWELLYMSDINSSF